MFYKWDLSLLLVFTVLKYRKKSLRNSCSPKAQLPCCLSPMKFDVQQSTTSPVLPFDIIALIIDIVGENENTDLLKKLALVSHCFHKICSKHLFATIELRDAPPNHPRKSTKEGFVKLLRSRPDVVKHIRKLIYLVGSVYLADSDSDSDSLCEDHPLESADDLSPILPNLLRTISRLNYLIIDGSNMKWNKMDSFLTSAFNHLLHLPTLNYIELSSIRNLPVSILAPCANLLRFDVYDLNCTDLLEEEVIVQSEMMPKIRDFRTSGSSLIMRKLLHCKRQDGRPAFNCMDLRRVKICLEDKENIRYFQRTAKLLDKLHLSVGSGQDLVGLRDILSPSAHTLKVLDFTGSIHKFSFDDSIHLPFEGLCEELEAMAGHNMLEAMSFEVYHGSTFSDEDAEDLIGSAFQDVERELVKPGWSALRKVSFGVAVMEEEDCERLCEALQFLPDKYLDHFPKFESITFSYSVYVPYIP